MSLNRIVLMLYQSTVCFDVILSIGVLFNPFHPELMYDGLISIQSVWDLSETSVEWWYFDGLAQDCGNSSANALELP